MAVLGKAPKRRTVERLAAADWVAAGRTALLVDGIAGVRIEALARRLNVTVGSFYWHWRDRPALLAALLEDWRTTSSQGLAKAAASAPDPRQALAAVIRTWIDETAYSPLYDAAVRDWARVDDEVARVVREVDDARIAMLKDLFRAMGYADAQAFIRARVAYFHQVGYYALRVVEARDTRHELMPLYLQVLAD